MSRSVKAKIIDIFRDRITQLLLILFWTFVLYGSEAYHSIYMICCCIAIVGWCKSYSMQYEKVDRIIVQIASVVFAIAIILANWTICIEVDMSPIGLLLMILSGYIVGRNCLEVLFAFFDSINSNGNFETVRESNSGSDKMVWLVTFITILIVDLLYLGISAYPGNLSGDSKGQVEQALIGNYTNHHPLWHTMVIKACLEITSAFGLDINKGVALYSIVQIVFIASIIAFVVYTVYQLGVPKKYIAVFVLWYALMPFHICYSVTMWKDIPFAGMTALTIVAITRILNELGENKRLNYVWLFIGCVGMGIFRSNGLFVLVLTLVAMAIVYYKKNKRLLLVLAGSSVIAYIMTGPYIKMIGVPQHDFIESLSIPAQQIAFVISRDMSIDDEQRNELSKIVNLDEVKEKYKPFISDPVKNAVRYNGDQKYLTEHKWDYFKIWLQIGIRHPSAYIYAWAEQTKGYWNAGYPYPLFTFTVKENDFGIVRDIPSKYLSDKYIRYFNMFENFDKDEGFFYLQPFVSIGLHVWLVCACGIYSFIRKRNWVIVVPILAVVLSLLVATPVFCEFRYIYSLFVSLPIVVFGTIWDKRGVI